MSDEEGGLARSRAWRTTLQSEPGIAEAAKELLGNLLAAESQVQALIGVLLADPPLDDPNIVRRLRARLRRG